MPRIFTLTTHAVLSLLAVYAGFGLAGCGREGAREPGLEWKGAPIEILHRTDKPEVKDLATLGMPSLAEMPIRLLVARVAGTPGEEAGDSLVLLDFGDDARAFVAFQEWGVGAADFMEGFAVRDQQVYFRRGRWIGRVSEDLWMGATGMGLGLTGMGAMVQNLSVPGLTAGGLDALPKEFSSLLHQGRVEGSERILTQHFLGLPFEGRIYAVRLKCYGDTAWAFASTDIPREFALRAATALQGLVDSSRSEWVLKAYSPARLPLKIRFSGAGMAGVEGCFDDSLSNFWIKMQSRGLKNLK